MVRCFSLRLVSVFAFALLALFALPAALCAQVFTVPPPENGRDPVPSALEAAAAAAPQGEPRRVIEERTGTLRAPEGSALRVATDIGTIRVTPRAGGGNLLSYRVRIEAPASPESPEKLTQLARQFVLTVRPSPAGPVITGRVPWKDFRGRLWVRIEVEVPRGLNLDLQTQAGNIETGDVDGRLSLVSGGGNLTAGNVSSSARLETQGGHVTIGDVLGDLTAITAGGHINAGNVLGNATLRSGGGHVRALSVKGLSNLDTLGGNITVFRASANVNASSGGGRIDLGQLSGVLHARTGGGGVRVAQVTGPSQLVSGGGSLYLTRVEGAVNASTGSGGITAWLVPQVKLQGVSKLESGEGDILVYVPRDMAITIEALVVSSALHRVEAEQGFPIKVSYVDPPPAGVVPVGASTAPLKTIRAECALNGGGEVLQLRALSGNIRLKFLNGSPPPLPAVSMQYTLTPVPPTPVASTPEMKARIEDESVGRIEEWQRRVAQSLWGRIRVTSSVQNAKVIYSIKPEYPQIARISRVEGNVRLEVTIGKEGAVEGVKVVSGHGLLTASAKQAVARWRYKPTYVGGKPVTVVTYVDVAFRLN